MSACVWPQGQAPRSRTASSSAISRRRRPRRWAPFQPQPLGGGLVALAVAGAAARGWWQQPDAFVVADRVDAKAGLLGKHGDGERGHGGSVAPGARSKVKPA